jgi:hypothetical protein
LLQGYVSLASGSGNCVAQKVNFLADRPHGIFQPATFTDQRRYGFASEAVNA